MASDPHERLCETLRRSVGALNEAGVPFVLGGSLACWARGGPRPSNDVDLMLPPDALDAALGALRAQGMRIEDVPEEWLAKVWDDEVMIDLITSCLGLGEITPEVIAGAEQRSVLAIAMPVLSAEWVIASKLLAINEQRLDYGGVLEIARALREQIDWPLVRERTAESPYARAFFPLLAELGIDTNGAR